MPIFDQGRTAGQSAPLRFPSERGVPYDAVQWAKDLATHFPHIRVDVEGA